jgi:hypothetical protein
MKAPGKPGLNGSLIAGQMQPTFLDRQRAVEKLSAKWFSFVKLCVLCGQAFKTF